MAAPSFLVTNYAGTTTPASDIIGLAEARLTAAGWAFVEEYAFTQNVGSTATTTNGSTTISSVTTPANLQNGYAVGGSGIPAGTTIVSGGNTATQVMSQAATAGASGVTLTASRAMRVWKNPASLNAAGVDFYIGFVKDAAGGPRLAVRAFEGWDATGKTIQNPCIQGNSSAAPNGTTYAATVGTNGVGTGSASWNPAGGTTPLMVDSIPPVVVANNVNYDVSVLASKSYLVLTILPNGGNTPLAAWTIGLYNPLWTDSQATYPPLMVCDILATNPQIPTTTGVSRAVRVTTATSANWGAVAGPESLLVGMVSFSGLSRERSSQSVRAARVALASYSQPFNTNGGYRGTMYDAMVVASDGTLKAGDTITVGSTTWTVLVPYVMSPAFVSTTTTVNGAYAFNTAAGS